MTRPQDRNLHLVMAVLMSLSLWVDQQEISLWRAGQVSMISLALAMVWIWLYFHQQTQARDRDIETSRERIQALEERVDELEREARQRNF